MNTKPPCRDCTHRFAECHAKCEPYKEYETRHAEELKERTRQKSDLREKALAVQNLLTG